MFRRKTIWQDIANNLPGDETSAERQRNAVQTSSAHGSLLVNANGGETNYYKHTARETPQPQPLYRRLNEGPGGRRRHRRRQRHTKQASEFTFYTRFKRTGKESHLQVGEGVVHHVHAHGVPARTLLRIRSRRRHHARNSHSSRRHSHHGNRWSRSSQNHSLQTAGTNAVNYDDDERIGIRIRSAQSHWFCVGEISGFFAAMSLAELYRSFRKLRRQDFVAKIRRAIFNFGLSQRYYWQNWHKFQKSTATGFWN